MPVTEQSGCRVDALSVPSGPLVPTPEQWRAEPDRFAEVFDAYHGEIYRYVASRLSIAQADDLAAETFLIAFRTRARFDGAATQVRAWLYGIATNLIRRHRRDEERKYRALARSEQTAWISDEEPADQVVSRVSAGRAQRRLAAALRSLKPRDRDVLLLSALGELSYAEVAEALGIPPGTVGSRLTRARRAVRSAFNEIDPTSDQGA